MEREPRTLAQIQASIKAARDSVWVIEDMIAQLVAGKTATNDRKGNIDRNVSHLKLVVADQEVIDSGEDITDLLAAIASGEVKLAEPIWPAAVIED
jgi:hypothetical protein